MNHLETKLDALVRLAMAQDEGEKAMIRDEIRHMPKRESFVPDAEQLARELLLEVGVPDHLAGQPYLLQAILLAVKDRSYIDKVTYKLYPEIARQFDTTASRVERAMRHAIEIVWVRCEYEVLNRYFGNSINPDKAKATNAEFIARLANVVKLRLAAYEKHK